MNLVKAHGLHIKLVSEAMKQRNNKSEPGQTPDGEKKGKKSEKKLKLNKE